MGDPADSSRREGWHRPRWPPRSWTTRLHHRGCQLAAVHQRHGKVDDQEIEPPIAFQHRQRFRPAGSLNDLASHPPTWRGRHAHARIIIDQQEAAWTPRQGIGGRVGHRLGWRLSALRRKILTVVPAPACCRTAAPRRVPGQNRPPSTDQDPSRRPALLSCRTVHGRGRGTSSGIPVPVSDLNAHVIAGCRSS